MNGEMLNKVLIFIAIVLGLIILFILFAGRSNPSELPKHQESHPISTFDSDQR